MGVTKKVRGLLLLLLLLLSVIKPENALGGHHKHKREHKK